MPELVTLAQVKAYLNLTTSAHDVELQGHIDAAVEAIEGYLCHLVVQREVVGERHQVRPRAGMLVLGRYPATSLTAATADDVDVDLAQLDLEPDSGIVWLSPDGPHGLLRVSYLAGPAAPSPAHQRAAEIITGNLFESQRIAGAGPQSPGVSADEQLVTDAYGVAIPPRARELLGPPTPMIG